MQHARATTPDPDHGACTDDVARALLVDLLHARELGWEHVAPSARRHLAFLAAAFEAGSGRFRNFRLVDGSWLDLPGSEDANARALHALGETIAAAPEGDVRAAAGDLFARALPTASEVSGLRPQATVLLACDAAERGGIGGDVVEVYQRVGNGLRMAFETREVTFERPWPEPVITYENELPARALIVGGLRLGYPRMTRTGFRVLDWLIDAQTNEDGSLSTVGNAGWWPKGGEKPRYDQQPISATSVLLAAGTAYGVTGEPRYARTMEAAYAWFLGRNDAGVPLADPVTGGCRDGIGPAGASENQGAESTLMWLIAAEHIRALRSATAARAATTAATTATAAAIDAPRTLARAS